MKKESCEVIRDLLPLYEDGVASEKAQTMVREHLKDCPACREELRKIHAPLSLPPEQDEEMWQKYAEQRAKLQRKRRKRIAIAAAVLAVIALFCLWYTRPMTFEQVCRELDWGEAGGISALYTVKETHPDGKVDTTFGSFNLIGDSNAIEELSGILNAQTYHRSLTSLLPRLNRISVIRSRTPYSWDIAIGGGFSLRLSNSTGKLDLLYCSDSREISLYCAVEDQEAFDRTVNEWLTEAAPEK